MRTSIFGDPDACIRVYNPSEPNLDKKLLAVYPNCRKAATALRVSPHYLIKAYSTKKKIYSPLYKMEVAIRFEAVSTTASAHVYDTISTDTTEKL